MQGLPLHRVTLHQFGSSPVPSVGALWNLARDEISDWLLADGYVPADVEAVINDFPQWAPYTSNDTEYFAAHAGSSLIAMLDSSLIKGEPVRAIQGFLFDFGFRPDGVFPAGFTGVPGLTNEKWLIEPAYNMNSLLAELKGTLTPVASDDPFIHAIAALDVTDMGVLVVNYVPLEYQVDLKYDYWEQYPIMKNNFVADDLSGVVYDENELATMFFGGVPPTKLELIDALLADPSPIDIDA